MLFDTTVKVNDVACLKLSNGDELIAKIVDITNDHIGLSKPMLMMLAQDPRTGQPGVSMVPFWMVGGDKDARYPVSKPHIVCMVKANPDAMKSYMQQTTGLTIPGSPGTGSIIT